MSQRGVIAACSRAVHRLLPGALARLDGLAGLRRERAAHGFPTTTFNLTPDTWHVALTLAAGQIPRSPIADRPDAESAQISEAARTLVASRQRVADFVAWTAFDQPSRIKCAGKMQTYRQPNAMEDAPYPTAGDRLLARKSGPWAKRKHHYLRNYCGITAKSMAKKWRLVYLDVMAGPGLCKIKETGEEFPGSPLIALDHEFHDFILIEEDPQLVDALKQRVAKHSKASLVEVI